ncbi:MAG: hypothetical protein AAFV71_19555 [Cyanobacteria bacterium J06633_8]
MSIITECPNCGSTDLNPSLTPSTSPHFARLDCNTCGRYIKWLSRKQFIELEEAKINPIETMGSKVVGDVVGSV